MLPWPLTVEMDESLSNIIIELMVIDASGEIRGRTRLQKTMFLLKEEYKMPITLHFEPYFYGPYSEELTYDLETLKAFKVIEEERVRINDYYEYRYKLTPKGKQILTKLLNSNQNLRKLHEDIKVHVKELNKIPLKDLVAKAKALLAISNP